MELRNIFVELKNSLEALDRMYEAGEGIDELKDRPFENTQRRKMKENEDYLQNIQNYLKRPNLKNY